MRMMIKTAKIISKGFCEEIIIPPLNSHKTEHGRLVLGYGASVRKTYIFLSINYMELLVGEAKIGENVLVDERNNSIRIPK